MATNLPPMLNLLATDAKGTTYDHKSLEYMRFVIRESSEDERKTLAEILREMKYAQFLRTVYWRIIKAHLMAVQPKCQRCRLKDVAHIHHRNYMIHGNEHDNVESLVGLCGTCHQRQHGMLDDLKQEVRERQAEIPSQGSNRGALSHISDFVLSVEKLLDGEPDKA